MMGNYSLCVLFILVAALPCSALSNPAEHGRTAQDVVQMKATDSSAAGIRKVSDPRSDSVAQLASRLFNEGEYTKTLALIDPSDSTSARLFYYQGMSAAALYDYPRAQQLLKRAACADSTNVNYRFQYGRFLAQAGFTDEAIRELSTCIAIDSLYLPASFQLGLLYNAQKTEFARQVDIFSYLVRRNPNDFLSLYYKGDALYRQQYQDSGMVFIQQSADLNPRYFPSIISVAHYKNAEKDTAGALAWYLRAESIRPRDKDLLYYIGECYRKLGSLDTAVCYFKRSLAIDSANAIVHAQLGYAYYAKGKFDSSIASYDRAIANDDDNTQYYLNLALAYEKIDSTQKVIQTYKRLISALHPKNLAIAWQYLASLYSRKEMLREAADAYQRVYDFNPDNSMALVMAADHYERAGNYRAALEIFEKMYRTPVDAVFKSETEKYLKTRINALKKKMQ